VKANFIQLVLALLFWCLNAFDPAPPIPRQSNQIDMTQQDTLPAKDSFLEDLLRQYPDSFAPVLDHSDSFRVQIIYTQIDRDVNNHPSFRDFTYHLDPDRYFYPASTVKLPVALLALQKLKELRLPNLDRNSSMITDAAYSGQTMVLNDPTTQDGRPTIAQYIRKILLVSDNDAFNRLFEFLGPGYIRDQLYRMGYGDAQIRHRLEVSLSADENRHTNPISFYDPAGRLLYQQPMQFDEFNWPLRRDSVGRAYYDAEGKFVPHAMDFSAKNRIGLADLHQMLRSVLFPASVPDSQRFGIKDDDYDFLYKYMSSYPEESLYPSYDTSQYWDAYGKFLYWGGQKGKLPKNIRIFSKEGDAYGFLTDLAYVVDFDRHVEFMLSCTIYCNQDGVLNDNSYDYDVVGLPFMKALGQVIYSYELTRPKPNTPNLLRFRFTYDK
jgi:Beta-lactamase enzyme family